MKYIPLDVRLVNQPDFFVLCRDVNNATDCSHGQGR